MTDFCYDPNLDLKERDPNDLVRHVKVQFSDVLGEPKESHSCDCSWEGSAWMYDCCFMIVYHLNSFFCGCWLACLYGIMAAHTGFCHTWILTPILQCIKLILYPFGGCWSICLKCLINPWCEACGYCFSAFETNPNPAMQWAA